MNPERRERIERALSKPVLNPAFVATRTDENTIHVRAGPWTGPAMTIRETDDEEAVADLFALLDGTNPIGEILAQFDSADRDDLLELLDGLAQKNVVYDAADRPESQGWPQLVHSRKFADENCRRLADAEILVVNAGEIGPQIAADLARAGVGEVAVTQPVADARADCSHLDGRENVTLLDDDVTAAVRDAEYVAFAADGEYPAVAAELNRVAHEADTPWMLVQRRGFDGLVGPVFFPGETGCYNCLERRIVSNLSNPEGYASYRNGLGEADAGSLASVGLHAYSRMLAGYATIDLLNLLAYGQAYTVGKTITVDFLDLSTEVNDVLRLPRCEVCGKPAGVDDKRFVTIEDVVEAKRRNRGEYDPERGGRDGGR
ncbi:TOMM precursor leader peptide-binding protein [Halorussus gelatinilyticus]|uniref:TOMM leader peptide-binding protein n=1 Tax=Halorussus gelatinilyticus TaxID=2937524 RepID=A0A8U0IPI2_9EURY|nr:TOMM precursor leader peptide-binding protein [Halorussus gelatinilyticus]UPW02054.1 TOMM precursor leader peptide-binding protein [Halorussus gelatinilyticus]